MPDCTNRPVRVPSLVALCAVVTLVWLLGCSDDGDSAGDTAPASSGAAAEAPVGPEAKEPERPVAPPTFGGVMKSLLGAEGSWSGAQARVWIEPDPVPDGGLYEVHFEAQCACSALLFAIDGAHGEITLVYPNPFESPSALAPGEARTLPSSGSYKLRAVGGAGLDILKLVVAEGDLGFPADAEQAWAASKDEPERLAELSALLGRLDGRWATADASLRIAR